MDDDTKVTSADLCRVLGVTREALSDFAKRGIIERGKARGTYQLEASVAGYCAHLREIAAGRGGERCLGCRDPST
jgi:phage terminase Nu1 subunit (DNA packaging protein)